MATKGNDCFERVFTDISPGAHWRHEPAPQPWCVEPCLPSLWGWSPSLALVGIDLLHVLHLGVLRDLCGSAIKVLVKSRGYFQGSSIPRRFKSLSRELKAFSRSMKCPLHLKRITKQTVDWKSNVCPELHVKAADCGTVLKFLCHRTQLVAPPAYQGMVVSLWAASNLVGLLMSANAYLTDAEKQSGYAYGDLFLRTYFGLASQAIRASEKLWKVRPKTHFLCHVVQDLQCIYRNPAKDATWMDEDVMKHTLHMRRRMAQKTSSLNVLRRYSVVCKTALEKHRASRTR